ncbi:MAG: PhoH family protein [Candidatus Eisenbacteria bacterium]|nr:PhoH family protein [Candidatus Eisenbacteria bacterium]
MKAQRIETIDLESIDPLHLFGERDSHLRWIEQRYEVEATLRGRKLAVAGSDGPVESAANLFRELISMVKRGQLLTSVELDFAASRLDGGAPAGQAESSGDQILQFERRSIYLKSPGQRHYVEAVRKNDIVFGIGPAGTGKTFLAVAMAVSALKDRQVERIVLVRPAVEAGESLGFLPGSYEEKVDPYLRPLYDALRDLIGHEKVRRFMETGVIEIAPLAYMRGRTLSRSFVILDEAQNTTVKQMKMFLTRLGPDSRAVITGDVTQIDLEKPETSGLVQIQSILIGIADIRFCYFEERDVVRHRLVRDILRAFNTHENREKQGS